MYVFSRQNWLDRGGCDRWLKPWSEGPALHKTFPMNTTKVRTNGLTCSQHAAGKVANCVWAFLQKILKAKHQTTKLVAGSDCPSVWNDLRRRNHLHQLCSICRKVAIFSRWWALFHEQETKKFDDCSLSTRQISLVWRLAKEIGHKSSKSDGQYGLKV